VIVCLSVGNVKQAFEDNDHDNHVNDKGEKEKSTTDEIKSKTESSSGKNDHQKATQEKLYAQASFTVGNGQFEVTLNDTTLTISTLSDSCQ
jgi:hypothetical protein